MNNLVEIASFAFPNDACLLESLLQKENIKYFLSSSVYAPAIETRLMVGSDDIPKVVEIMKKGGFEKYLNNNIITNFLNN